MDYVSRLVQAGIRPDCTVETVSWFRMQGDDKALDKAMADAAYTAAMQELSHVDMWHAQVVRMIKEEQAKGKETPAGMMMVYEWEHKKQIDGVTRIKMMLEQYKK